MVGTRLWVPAVEIGFGGPGIQFWAKDFHHAWDINEVLKFKLVVKQVLNQYYNLNYYRLPLYTPQTSIKIYNGLIKHVNFKSTLRIF